MIAPSSKADPSGRAKMVLTPERRRSRRALVVVPVLLVEPGLAVVLAQVVPPLERTSGRSRRRRGRCRRAVADLQPYRSSRGPGDYFAGHCARNEREAERPEARIVAADEVDVRAADRDCSNPRQDLIGPGVGWHIWISTRFGSRTTRPSCWARSARKLPPYMTASGSTIEPVAPRILSGRARTGTRRHDLWRRLQVEALHQVDPVVDQEQGVDGLGVPSRPDREPAGPRTSRCPCRSRRRRAPGASGRRNVRSGGLVGRHLLGVGPEAHVTGPDQEPRPRLNRSRPRPCTSRHLVGPTGEPLGR